MVALAITVGLLVVLARCNGKPASWYWVEETSKHNQTGFLVSVDGIHYLLNYYRMNWREAYEDCEAKEGSLAVLDTERKQNAIALALAENNPEREDLWIGATFKTTTDQWTWFYPEESKLGSNITLPKLPVGPDPKDKPLAHCVALDTHGRYAELLFVNLPCNLNRTSLCQMPGLDPHDPRPILPPIISEKDSSTIMLFEGLFNWEEADAFCYRIGQQLAVITTLSIMQKLSEKLLLARPEIEGDIWLGARKNGKRWVYYSKYFDHPVHYTENRCRTLDVRSAKSPILVDLTCSEYSNFACQTVSRNGVLASSRQASHEWARVMRNESIYLSLLPLPWAAAAKMCASKKGHLLHLNNVTQRVSLGYLMDRVSFAMIYASVVVNHVWLGGRMVNTSNNDTGAKKWAWVKTDTPLPGEPTFILRDLDRWVNVRKNEEESENYSCLNLDCDINYQMEAYGIQCDYPQHFFCQGMNFGTDKNTGETPSTSSFEELDEDSLNNMFYQGVPDGSSNRLITVADTSTKHHRTRAPRRHHTHTTPGDKVVTRG